MKDVPWRRSHGPTVPRHMIERKKRKNHSGSAPLLVKNNCTHLVLLPLEHSEVKLRNSTSLHELLMFRTSAVDFHDEATAPRASYAARSLSAVAGECRGGHVDRRTQNMGGEGVRTQNNIDGPPRRAGGVALSWLSTWDFRPCSLFLLLVSGVLFVGTFSR